jgi:hypothetical protein
LKGSADDDRYMWAAGNFFWEAGKAMWEVAELLPFASRWSRFTYISLFLIHWSTCEMSRSL